MDSWLPGQENIQIILTGITAQVREFLQKLEEICMRVQSIGFRRFHQCVNNGAGFCTFRGIREQPIFSSDYKGADGVLGKIIGNIHLTMIQKHGQASFLVLSIGHRLRQLAARDGIQGFQP